jgi:hypothetical protein
MSETDTATHRLRILDKTEISHDVNRWVVEKPDGYTYEPGQAAEVSLDKERYRDQGRPFTFTSLPGDAHLEFTIKTYPSHEGVTEMLDGFSPREHLLVSEPFGAIAYKGEGTFIAGGAGVTPFISILRQREAQGDMGINRLIFANDTAADVFMRDEFDRMLGGRATYLLSKEDAPFAERGKVDRAFLSKHCSNFADQYFYLCGPPGMGESVKADLLALGADEAKIVHEDWSG